MLSVCFFVSFVCLSVLLCICFCVLLFLITCRCLCHCSFLHVVVDVFVVVASGNYCCRLLLFELLFLLMVASICYVLFEVYSFQLLWLLDGFVASCWDVLWI